MVEERVLFQVRAAAPGPTLIVVGGIHGNEPAGVRAVQRTFLGLGGSESGGGLNSRAEGSFPISRGEVVALAGNMRALREGRRHLVRDLNRQWSPARLTDVPLDAEGMELRELRAELDAALARARGPVYFIDLHTTSAAGIPFALSRDSAREREFAAHFPLPVILGLVDQVEGVVAEYMTKRGCVALSVEGGQHVAPNTEENLCAVLQISLWAAGLIEREALSSLPAALTTLSRARGDLPLLIEVQSRHAITAEDAFRMEAGFANICRVNADTLLARDCRGEIRAPHDGLVLLPLYQPLGDDGFFFGREVG
jgi:predicted deacylase